MVTYGTDYFCMKHKSFMYIIRTIKHYNYNLMTHQMLTFSLKLIFFNPVEIVNSLPITVAVMSYESVGLSWKWLKSVVK